jgi:leader peptidase (prepilin peptidase)/N-methyltransferase
VPTPSRLRLLALAAAVGLVAACLAVFGLTAEAVIDAAACVVLVVLTVTDLEERRIPNRIVVPALVVALLAQTIRDPSIEWIVSALAAGGFFFVAALVYPPGLGMGDVKLGAFLGAWLGRHVAVAFFAGSVIALVPAIVIMARLGAKRGRKVGIPYGPFLALGGVIALFWGEKLMDVWLG